MQAASDIFLGWVHGEGGRDFYIRQLHDMKGSVDTTTILPIGLTTYARLCGATLAGPRPRWRRHRDRRLHRHRRHIAEAIEEFARCTPTKPNRTTDNSNRPSPKGRSPSRPASERSDKSHGQGPVQGQHQGLQQTRASSGRASTAGRDPPLIVPIEDLLPESSTTRSTKQSTICCAPIAARSQAIIAISWKDSATRTRRARWSEWAVSAHAPGFC